MHVRLKLIDVFRDFLPPGSDASHFMLEVETDATVQDIFSMLNIPDDLPRVVLWNGQIAKPDQRLADNDVVAIFSPVFGG